ncbi:MAG: hypothetical protein ACXWLM_01195 [Myxococcales bacterium]
MPRTFPSFLRVGDRSVRVESFSGAEPFAEVVNEPGGLLPYAKKHLGAIRWADLEADVGIDSDPALYQWIGDTWFGQPAREKAVLDTFDPISRRAETIELTRPLLREVVLPALDARAHDQRFLKLRIAPQSVRRRPGGSVVVDEVEPGRELYAHAFTVEIDGIDCSGVQAVAPIAVQTRPEERKKGGLLAFSDVHLQVSAGKLGSFEDWFEDFVLRGNNDDDKERDGRITFYDPLLKDALATLELYHLGVYRVGAAERSIAQVDLYCERMELKTFTAL